MSHRRVVQLRLIAEPAPTRMPRTRAECANVPRPCPHVQCEHHLAHEAMVTDGPSCVLDVADQGPHTLDQIGRILGVGRERARQIEEKALGKAWAYAEALGLTREDALHTGAPAGHVYHEGTGW